MKRPSASILLVLLLGSVAGAATPAVAQTADEIIAKARAYLGGDAALSLVHSVHFRGVLETQKMTATGLVPQKATVEIFFQKPYQQLIVATGAEAIESTGLDGYIAWQSEQDRTDPTRWNLSTLGPEMTKALRATTWENLYFYKGIGEQGGKVTVVGPAMIEGHAAIKVAFAHDADLVFTRYFDPASGQLLFTETKDRTIREEGEILVNGLRFPQKVIQTIKGLDANRQPVERTHIMTFDTITLNEVFPASYFEMPRLPHPAPAAKAASGKPPATPAAPPAAAKPTPAVAK